VIRSVGAIKNARNGDGVGNEQGLRRKVKAEELGNESMMVDDSILDWVRSTAFTSTACIKHTCSHRQPVP
jgi:hypothetical protein